MWENIKRWGTNEQVFTVCLLVVVASVSFVLGQKSVLTDNLDSTNQIVVTYGAFAPADNLPTNIPTSASLPALVEQTAQAGQIIGSGGEYVASRSGARYHHLTCPGAKQIKEVNKIFFLSPEAAEAAGYTRAANCQR